MKLVFCGTPAFAVPTLEAVLRAKHTVSLVATQPDRPAGRHGTLHAPPVKESALAHGIRVVQPEKIKNNLEFRQELENIAPDAILIVAYGRIVPKWMLDLPRYGNINLHGSLLPKYRGAAPIQWAVANGETVTGVTTMRIDEGLDTGEMLLQASFPVGPDATSEDLFRDLAGIGAALVVDTLAQLESGSLQGRPQNDAEASHAPILRREDALVDFNQPAQWIYNRWRGFQPWPGAYTTLLGKKLTLHTLRPVERTGAASPGEVVVERDTCLVACGQGTWLQLFEVQLEGKKRMPVAEFLRGQGTASSLRLGA